MTNLQQYSKAIVALVAPIVTGLLLKLLTSLGLPFTTDMQNAIVVLITGLLVYLIPNIEK